LARAWVRPLGEDDEGHVEGDGAGVERFDDVGEALFDDHSAGVAGDEFSGAGGGSLVMMTVGASRP
jgi:hypothetical protein